MESIRMAFQNAIDFSETHKHKLKGIEHFGHYYMVTRQFDNAKPLLNLAIEISGEAKYHPYLAESGLRWISSVECRGIRRLNASGSYQ